MVDVMVDVLPSEVSCLKETRGLDVKEIGRPENSNGIMAEKSENGVGLVICPAPCLVSSDQDTLSVKLPNEKHVGFTSHVSGGEIVGFSSLSDEMENEGCQTPTGKIFDPFAPGPEDLGFAPKKKTMKETRIPLRRQLNFDYCIQNVSDDDEAEEGSFLESVRTSFLDLIVSNQLRGLSANNLFIESTSSKVCKTPTSIAFSTGSADTCPAAPMRPSSKSRRLADEICRKLEFGL